MAEHTFRTRGGVTLHLTHVSKMLIDGLIMETRRKFEEEHGKLEKPTYTTSVGEVFTHDEKSIVDETTPDEEKQAWQTYRENLGRVLIAQSEQAVEAYLFMGVIEEPPDGWDAQLKALGVAIPDDAKGQKLCWLDKVVLSNREERMTLAHYIKAMADPVEVEAAKAADTFPHNVEKT